MRFRTLAFALLLLLRFVSTTRAEHRLHIEDTGSGSPVVLIPSFASSAYGYRKVTADLVDRGFRTIVIEPLGTGSSSRPPGADYSFSAQAERLARELDAAGIERAVFVSQGSCTSIVFRLALRRPEMVAAVVSLEGGAAEEVATPGLRRASRFAPLLRLFGGAGRVRSEMKKGLVKASGDASWVTDEVVEAYAAGAAGDLDATLRVVEGMVRAREPEPLRPRLADIRCPIDLLLGGAPHEGGVDPDEVRLLQNSLPRIRIYTVPDAGHFIGEERPAVVVTAVSRLARATADKAVAINTNGSGDFQVPDPRR